jgi:hypothetical protein
MTDSDVHRVVVAELAARLRPICAEWPQELFNEMVERLAEITLKYDRSFSATYDRRSTERLVAELRAALERSRATREGESRDPEGAEAEPGLTRRPGRS